MGQHNPAHLRTDLTHMRGLGCDDVLLAAQENDFVHMTGKIDFTPELAREAGLRPIAIFWGVLNLFGGGRSSQFLLEHPDAFQVTKNGKHHHAGCYVNPACTARIKEMIDTVAEKGFAGYFVDEPTPMDCWCPSCAKRFETYYGAALQKADEEMVAAFRRRCVTDYIRDISAYCKANHPQLETQCCLMTVDRGLWKEAATIPELDNLGTDIYWANTDDEIETMTPMVRELADVCGQNNKLHHEWLQAWDVREGNEARVEAQGEILVRERPDAIYVWAYLGQVGTTETCDDPETVWKVAETILTKAKE